MFVGCYQWNLINSYSYEFYSDKSYGHDACKQSAIVSGLTHFGLIGGKKCKVGNFTEPESDLSTFYQSADAHCSMKCGGDLVDGTASGTFECGGTETQKVYQLKV